MPPLIIWEAIEGGRNGEIVKEAIVNAIANFFRLGTENIEIECNNVSDKYRNLWSSKQSTDLMLEYNCPISYQAGCNEIMPVFRLFTPNSIRVRILDSYYQSRPNELAATTEQSLQDPMNPIITIYLRPLQILGSNILWTGFKTSFESIIYHELLHAYGDSTILRSEIHDGLFRHTLIASEAINNLS